MDDLYNHLDNYDDVEAINRLKAENSDLKHKLEDCYRDMQGLQQAFDNLEAEFQRLQTNYSSLLKISRAEIQRKTEMITSLNIEKDLLVIKAVQSGGSTHNVKQLIRNVREETEVKRKKKTRSKKGGQKGKEELFRQKSRPSSPATSCTSTDNSNTMTGNERVTDKNIDKYSKTAAQEKEPQDHEVLPDNHSAFPVADKRVSALSRRKSVRTPSPATSSNSIDNSNKITGNERLIDNDINKSNTMVIQEKEPRNHQVFHKDINKSNKMFAQENESQNHEVLPDNHPASISISDKRVSALSRRKSVRTPSPATSSNTTDYSNKMTANERFTDKAINKYSKMVAQENEPHNHQNRETLFHKDINKSNKTVTQEIEPNNHEVFPDNRPASPVADKRLSALSRHQFGRLSSDEEFEDMYSALKPKTTKEPERNRKRGRDDSHDGKVYNSSHRPYPDPYRERLNRNKSGRFSDNERNINREKQHNESDRSTNRSKQCNNDRSRNANESRYQRFSPEKHRRGAKELGDDRYRNRRLESPPRERQRLGSPQRENHQFKKIRERRKSYHGREGEHREPETTIHGAYGEPQNKKPRIEPNPVHQEEKRPSEKQDNKESHPPDMGNPRSKTPSPDFSHTEESSNGSVTGQSGNRSMARPVFKYEDPRRISELYVKCSDGNGKALQCAHANKIYLLPVDKSLWNLQEVQVPKALRSKPAEISEEQVDKMDSDTALSIASLESGELDSETTDTALGNNDDFQDHNRQNDSNVPKINECRKIDKPHKENSPADNHMTKDNRHRSEFSKNESVTTRHKLPKAEKARNRRRDEPLTPTSKDSHKADTSNKHSDNTQMPSILQKLIHSMNEQIPDRDSSVKVSNSREENEPKKIAESRISNKTNKAGSKIKPDFKPDIKNTEKTEEETERNRAKEPKKIAELKTRDELRNKTVSELKTTDKVGKETENIKEKELKMAESKILDTNEKKSLKTRDYIEPQNVSELKTADNPEKVTKNNTEKELQKKDRITESMTLDRDGKESLPSYEEEHRHVSELKTIDKPEKVTENNVTIFREFEHRVYSRHIVEGDLELSDESNDETLPKIEEKPKANLRKKSHRETSKVKRAGSDKTRKSRYQKDKKIDKKSINKFSELFGDSSSLITPEDLNLATRTAHGLPADCCPPAAEEAQDIIIENETVRQTTIDKSDFRDSLDKLNITETKYKHKDSKESRTRTEHKQNKDRENETEPNDKHKDSSEQIISEKRIETVTSTKSQSGSEENLVLLDYRIKRLQNAKKSNDAQKNYAKLNENPKDSLNSNKRPKTKGDKKLAHSEHSKDIDTNENYNTPETTNNTLTTNDNKENTSKNSNLEGNVSNEMSRISENAIVPSKTSSSDVSEINKEIPQLNDSTKETISSSAIQDVPNLAPVSEEPGLVKMVVISTGVQPLHSDSVQYATSFNALASSTPAKDLSAINISSEVEAQVNHSAQVSVTIAREDSVSQPEADIPDMRITCYRRRRKVLKR